MRTRQRNNPTKYQQLAKALVKHGYRLFSLNDAKQIDLKENLSIKDIDSALSSLEIMKRAGVKMGLGTDLLGTLHVRQSTEFTLRAKVLPAIDVLRSACMINAELLGQKGKLGCIREGAIADVLVLDGNPLEDMSVLGSGGDHISVIMQDGRFHKRTI